MVDISLLARYPYRRVVDSALKKQKATKYKYVWRFHRELSPARIISLRTYQAHFGQGDVGNRNVVIMLVRFDTEQVGRNTLNPYSFLNHLHSTEYGGLQGGWDAGP